MSSALRKSSENLIYCFSTFQLVAKNMGLITMRRFPGSVRVSMGKILRWCCKSSCADRKEENALDFPSFPGPSCVAVMPGSAQMAAVQHSAM